MTDATTPTSDPAKMWDLIKDIRFAMFTTRDSAHGHLHSRPMTTQNGRDDRGASLWFFMSRGGEPVANVAAASSVNVAYADPQKDTYVSVAGEAAVVEDLAKKKALWGPLNQAWFPGGPEDPDLALVEVRISHADYWDVKANKLTQLYRMAKAAVTGTTPDDMGEHGQVRPR